MKNKGLGGKPAILRVANSIIFDLKKEFGKEVLNGVTETIKEILKVNIWNAQYKRKKCHITCSLEMRPIETQAIEYTEDAPIMLISLVWIII